MRWTKFQPKRKLDAQTRALCDALIAEEDGAPGAKISERGWTIVREIESHGWYVTPTLDKYLGMGATSS